MRNHLPLQPSILPVFLAISCSLLPLSAADRPLEEGLPSDTLMFVKVSDYGQVLEDMENNPLLAFWEEDEIQEFFGPVISKMEEAFSENELKEELGIDEGQFREMFPGQMVLSVTEIDWSNLKKDDIPGKFIGLAEYGGDFEIIDKLIHHSLQGGDSNDGIKPEVVEREYLGAKIWMLEESDDTDDEESEKKIEVEIWAAFEDILMVSTSLDQIHETISLLENESPEASIRANPTYARMVYDGSESELFFFMNLRDFVTSMKAEVNKDPHFSQPNQLGFSGDSVWQAFAPDVLEGFYVTMDTDDEEPVIYSGFLYTENRGIMGLLPLGQGEVSKPNYISKDVFSVKVSLFSLSEFWDNLEGLIAAVSPFWYQNYEAILSQLTTSSEVDFRTSFFGNFGDEIVSFSEVGEQTDPEAPSGWQNMDTVILLNLKDRQGFEIALEALKSMFQGEAEYFAKREYLGVTIFSYNATAGLRIDNSAKSVFSYALTDRYLLLGFNSVSLLEATLARLEESPSESLWDDEDVEEALSDLGQGSAATTYQDFGPFLNVMLDTLASAQTNFHKDDPDYFEFCDPSKLPDQLEFPYFFVAKTFVEKEGLFSKAIIRKKSE